MRIDRLTRYLLPAAILLAGIGCTPPAVAPAPRTLELHPSTLFFAAEEAGVPKRISVETDAPSFRIAVSYSGADKEWLETAQGEHHIAVSPRSIHTGAHERNALLTVTVDGAPPRTVGITQKAGGEEESFPITLTPSLLEFPAAGTSVARAKITTAGSDLRVTPTGEAGWYEVRIEKQELVVEVAPNPSSEAREGEATLSNAQGGKARLALRQAGIPASAAIRLDPASLTFAAAGDGLTKTVGIVSSGSDITATVAPGCAEWLAVVSSREELSVTAAVNYGDERHGEVTVRNAEGAFAVLDITQQAAGDTGIVITPDRLSFGPEGGRSNCGITSAGTGLTAETAPESKAWLSATVSGTLLEVTVAPWDGRGVRTGTIAVHTAQGDRTVLPVSQQGAALDDLCGTWQWQSLSVTTEEWTQAATCSGTATVTRDGDGYALAGIAGHGVTGLGVAPEATFRLAMRNGTAGIVFGEAFRQGGTSYYSAPHLEFPTGIVEAWTEPETFLPVSMERDASGLERLLFPDRFTASPEHFPHARQLWGETAAVDYIYYETLGIGGNAIPVPVEFHRHIVLSRQRP